MDNHDGIQGNLEALVGIGLILSAVAWVFDVVGKTIVSIYMFVVWVFVSIYIYVCS